MTDEAFMATLASAEGYFSLGEAREAWDILIALPEEFRNLASVSLLRVTILLSLEQWAKAEDLAQAAVELTPEDARLWYVLSVAQAKQGRLEPAIRSIKEACVLDQSLWEVMMADDAFSEIWHLLR